MAFGRRDGERGRRRAAAKLPDGGLRRYLESPVPDRATPVDELARRLSLSREDTLLAMESGYAVRSLSEPLAGDGSLLLEDTIGEDKTGEVLMRIDLEAMLGRLEPKERELIRRRYFLDQTQTRIAAELGMTQVQVSRTELKLKARLRQEWLDSG